MRVRTSERGFSSLEMMISILLFMSLFAAMGTSASSVNLQLQESNRTSQSGETARIALDHIVRELRGGARGTATPATPAPSSSITYRVVEGWTNGAQALSAPKTLALVGTTLQLDGVTLVDGVDVLEISRVGNLVTIRVTAEVPLNEQSVVSTEWVAHVAN
mgnify:CR=1 FL=1